MNINAGKAKEKDTAKSSVIAIRPLRRWVSINLGELWNYRNLLYIFVWRDIKVRYKQTVFGLAWAIAQPLLMMLVFSLFFGQLASVPSQGIPYPLFSYSALLPWTFFSSGITKASNSLVNDSTLIQKVYFPRLLTPIASILSPLVDFFIAFVILFGLMLYYGYLPGITMLWLPLFLILELMLALGVGLWFSAINVEYRDIASLIPFLIQLWLYASPVIYSSSFIPERFQAAYGLINPMSGIIEGFRWAILGTEPPSYLMMIPSACIIVAVLVSGAFYFRSRERTFADVV